jgi:Domain of unknown function (DUF4349)
MGRIATALLGALALAACTAGGDDDDGGGAAGTDVAAETVAPAATEAPTETEAGGQTAAPEAPDDDESAAAGGRGAALRQLAGPSIAIEATATLRTDDVRRTVDRITGFVVRRGGRVASADIDFAPDLDERGTPDSRATLVLAVPPAELVPVVDHLDDLGTVLAFDQLAEDVTEQLVDLDSRINNTRASVERVRVLLAEATDIQGIVRLEAELTDREIELETLLASQRQLEERVAMSTLTLDIVVAPPETFAAVRHEFDPPRPGVVEALGDGWGAFVTGAHAVVLGVATILPFLAAAALLAIAILWVRRTISRAATTANRPG